jgi:hypothetical protein
MQKFDERNKYFGSVEQLIAFKVKIAFAAPLLAAYRSNFIIFGTSRGGT